MRYGNTYEGLLFSWPFHDDPNLPNWMRFVVNLFLKCSNVTKCSLYADIPAGRQTEDGEIELTYGVLRRRHIIHRHVEGGAEDHATGMPTGLWTGYGSWFLTDRDLSYAVLQRCRRDPEAALREAACVLVSYDRDVVLFELQIDRNKFAATVEVTLKEHGLQGQVVLL